jgi:hypothetical protein
MIINTGDNKRSVNGECLIRDIGALIEPEMFTFILSNGEV